MFLQRQAVSRKHTVQHLFSLSFTLEFRTDLGKPSIKPKHYGFPKKKNFGQFFSEPLSKLLLHQQNFIPISSVFSRQFILEKTTAALALDSSTCQFRKNVGESRL